MQEYDVVGIGNAIVDIIARVDELFLARQAAQKAACSLWMRRQLQSSTATWGPQWRFPAARARTRSSASPPSAARPVSSARRPGHDLGQVFGHDIRTAGVTFNTPPAAKDSEPTGRCLVLVTPDGQRTMNTFLGVSPQLGGGEVDAELVASARIVYLEGYLFDRPEAKSAFRQAAGIAAKAGRQVALSLSDAFCVDRHRAEFSSS